MSETRQVEDRDPRVDGRSLRSVRSRQLVVEAFLDLLNEGVVQPTALEASERSGVSMSSIFRLFDDVEAMHAAAVKTQVDRMAHLIVDLDDSAPFERRVRSLVESRARLFEAISPVRRMAVRLARTSDPIRSDLELSDEFFRAQIAELFATELAAMRPSRRRDVLDTLDAATCWETWERLRGPQAVSDRRARRIVGNLVRAAFTDPPQLEAPARTV